jgi:Na+/melibiose symporter-like transporter
LLLASHASAFPSDALFVVPQALLAIIIDSDEQRTGERREAIY